MIERELADKRRAANREEPRHLYRFVYDELYERVPFHPGLTRKVSPEGTRLAVSAFLRRFHHKDQTFLELGPGDCALSFAVPSIVHKVYAVDVSSRITESSATPPNFKLIISEGCGLDIPPDTLDLVYSYQALEHVHPDDVIEQLQSVYRSPKPGGKYVRITLNRLDGPHDISRYFTRAATGFHLRE